MNDEIQMVLDMVSQGKITAEEGIALIAKVQKDQQAESTVPPVYDRTTLKKKKLYIEVRETEDGKKSVHVAFPMTMVRKGFSIGKSIGLHANSDMSSLRNLDIDEILAIAAETPEGERAEVLSVDEENGSHVTIYIQ